jgi:hypothetical protein
MPGKATPSLGNIILEEIIYLPAATYPTIAASGPVTTTTVSLPGAQLYDYVSVTMISPPTHLTIGNAYVSAPGVVTVSWSSDATGVTGGTTPVLIDLARVDGANLGLQAFPQAVV